MPRRFSLDGLSQSQVEMRELGLEAAPWPVGPSFLLSLALANITATTLSLIFQ
jgi:hypothetical protein